MDKLTLAHEYAKVLLQQQVTRTIGDVVSISFGLAEEMLAEEEKRKDKSRPEVIEKVDNVDWVDDFIGVDWSQAPIFANWWAVDSNGDAYWHSCVDEPFVSGDIFEIANPQGHTVEAPTFNYKGNWKHSLSKRP